MSLKLYNHHKYLNINVFEIIHKYTDLKLIKSNQSINDFDNTDNLK